jgi:hypothetical protein
MLFNTISLDTLIGLLSKLVELISLVLKNGSAIPVPLMWAIVVLAVTVGLAIFLQSAAVFVNAIKPHSTVKS